MNKRVVVYFISILFVLNIEVSAQSRQDFIKKYRKIAVEEMERTGIPASITLAQGILESSCGESELTKKANNFFGIKCHDWEGATYHMDDDAKNECFRKYANIRDSWRDHSDFLTSRSRYADLFKLSATDYRGWAKGLKKAGYATNPQYAQRLIDIIEEEGLHVYDKKETITAEKENIKTTSKPSYISGGKFKENYNKRTEMVNGLLCIKMKEEDSIDVIGEYFGIKPKKLVAYNELKYGEIIVGQNLFLKRKKCRAARGYTFHRIKGGDSLYTISQQYGVKMKCLLKYNSIDGELKLLEGEKFYLRKKMN